MTCPVPFCSIDNGPEEKICRTHMRLVSPMVRAGLRRARERMLRLPAGNPERARLFALRQKFWQRAKKQASERASGI